VAGVTGASLTSKDILLTALAGALAGAISMAAGEYVATKSQNEVMKGEISLEEIHVKNNLNEEMSELDDLLRKIGIKTKTAAATTTTTTTINATTTTSSGGPTNQDAAGDPEEDTSASADLQELIKDFYRENPDALLEVMKALEFGVLDNEVRSPVTAALFSCILFILGSLPSVVPFTFSGTNPTTALIISACITVSALLMVGAIKTWATRGNCLVSALENLIIAGCGGGIAYGVGYLFESVIR
jgi:VIT1/CCC1 family predicted Fe2+/Mn2+ transporter